MLLTLSQSGKPEFGVRPPHELASPPPPHPALRYSPHRPLDNILGGGPPNNYAMSTQHRGLPPPSAMTLPEPRSQQPPPPPPHGSSTLPSQPQLGALPAPPSQWQGGEDSMRHWLSTKAEEERTKQEEEKRRQEEERTRQETLKLEQRRVEQTMLRESMTGGIPPQMIPVIFAGIGGHSLVSASVEMLHHYAAQLQASQQQVGSVVETSPEQARETRMVNPPQPNPFAAPPQPPSAQAQPPAPLSQHQNTFSAYGTSTRGPPPGPTSAPRSVPATGLSRINTIDIAQPSGPSQAQHGPSEQTSSSPSIYFHHWVPPATQETKGHQPPTPIGRTEPSSAHPSHAGEADYKDSPRKRKAPVEHAESRQLRRAHEVAQQQIKRRPIGGVAASPKSTGQRGDTAESCARTQLRARPTLILSSAVACWHTVASNATRLHALIACLPETSPGM
ncbi:hypothetical protein K461DRAFT_295259 [Myriangium duriaei CBS 260.36]|uniref:Uncharacterized protein n=1 Tax=Myriangium duriaei CBS 260.36 TaxID=1168546 RepID=A0A9P4MKW8_9PEZI|nr:hypothetical protein K461DRAFT_295259 [Myriangium duriaei CBS 260.36]